MKKHTDIDWEYETEKLAYAFADLKYNIYPYYETKAICEDEVMYYMAHEEDTMPLVRRRIRYRIKNHIQWFQYDDKKKFHDNFEWFEWNYNDKHDRRTFNEIKNNIFIITK